MFWFESTASPWSCAMIRRRVSRPATRPAVTCGVWAAAPACDAGGRWQPRRRLRRSSGAYALAGERPADVFAHERRGIVHPGTQRGHRARAVARIAQSHREVAQPALVADAADRAAGEAFLE